MKIQSSAFENGGTIQKKYTCDGEDVNPSMIFSEIPPNTKSLAIICDDPDAPGGIWVHWVIFNVPADTREIISGATGIGIKGKNDFRKLGYGGPCPPPGPAHTYRFKLYALDKMLPIKEGTTKAELEKAMNGHVIASAQLDAKYGR